MDVNAAYYISMQAGVPPLGISLPGEGKTSVLKSFAEATNRQIYILIGSIREPSDIGGIPFLREEKADPTVVHRTKEHAADGTSVYFELVAPKWAKDTTDGDWIIVYDELTCNNPSVQSAMLRPLAEGWVGDFQLPERTWQCALGNPPGIAANGHSLEPPLANRVCHLGWRLDDDSWHAGMRNGMNFPAPTLPVLPAGWEDGIREEANLVSAYLTRNPDARSLSLDEKGNYKGDREALSGAYVSPRSWSMLAINSAAAKACNMPGIVVSELRTGCVGASHAREYENYLDTLDLPDPEQELQRAIGASEFAAIPVERPDQLIAFLGSLTARVVANRKDTKRFTLERWTAALEIFISHDRDHGAKEVAISCAKPLFGEESGQVNVPKGVKIPKYVMDEWFPRLSLSQTGGNR